MPTGGAFEKRKIIRQMPGQGASKADHTILRHGYNSDQALHGSKKC
jgi:hypothetical protein